MGGPWKARGFDPEAWRPPESRGTVRAGTEDPTTRVVLGYVVAAVAACCGLLILLARFA